MSNTKSVGLQEEIIEELTIELKNDPAFDVDILRKKVKDAYRKVRAKREYKNTSYTEAQIEEDMYDNYFQYVNDLALYSFNKIGAEFQESHSENNVSRTWRSEDDILKGVHAFVKVF